MTSPFPPSGIFSAQWIPIDALGRVDRASLAAHIELERRAGISGILALGSTGEFPYFTLDERRTVLAMVTELASPLPVFANISDIRPRAAIELGLHAKSLGVPAVALMPPMFYPMSQADMLAYFLHVADAVGLPVMLYNFPELAGKRIEPATVAAFAERAPMVAIKQSGGEFEYHRELIALGREKGFVVMSGADTRLPEAYALGAAGCIGGLVNIVPELMVQIDRVCRLGGPGDATTAAATVREVGRILDQVAFPLNVAAGVEARGFSSGTPKMVVSAESRALYEQIVVELTALFERGGMAVEGAGGSSHAQSSRATEAGPLSSRANEAFPHMSSRASAASPHVSSRASEASPYMSSRASEASRGIGTSASADPSTSLGMTAGADPSTSLGMTEGADPSTALGMTEGADPSTALGMTDDGMDAGTR